MSGTKIEVAGKDSVFKEINPDPSVNIDMILPEPHKPIKFTVASGHNPGRYFGLYSSFLNAFVSNEMVFPTSEVESWSKWDADDEQ